MRKKDEITIIFGTRSQIIKSVPVIRELKKQNIPTTLVDTGQHYDYEMNKIFMEKFELPFSNYTLDVRSGDHGYQTGTMMIRIEKVLSKKFPSVCLIPGDSNSALAGTLVSVKKKIPITHLESGSRSLEEFMPELINRKIIDHVSQLLVTPTLIQKNNLLKEGIPANRIVNFGDTMYDLLLMEKKKINEVDLSNILKNFRDEYVVLTIHRAENTENLKNLKEILNVVKKLNYTVIFPMHPRTKILIKKTNFYKSIKKINNLKIVKPLGYHEMMKLVQNAKFVITDSGGLQKEALMLRKLCITIRPSTGWLETIELGSSKMVIANANLINKQIHFILDNYDDLIKKLSKIKIPYGNGKSSIKIVKEIKRRFL